MLQYPTSAATLPLYRHQIVYDWMGGMKVVTACFAGPTADIIKKDLSLDKLWTSKPGYAGDHSCYHREIGNKMLLLPASGQTATLSFPDPVTGARVTASYPMCSKRTRIFAIPDRPGLNTWKRGYSGSYVSYYTRVESTKSQYVTIHVVYMGQVTFSPARVKFLSMCRVVYPAVENGTLLWKSHDFSKSGTLTGQKVVSDNTSGLVEQYFSSVLSDARTFVQTFVDFEPKFPPANEMSLSLSPLDPKRKKILFDHLRTSFEIADDLVHRPTKRELGDATANAVDNCKYVDVNSCMFLRDLPQVGGELKEYAKTLKNFKSPKAWACSFLSTKFGTQLTWSDAQKIYSGVSRASKSLLERKGFSTARGSGYHLGHAIGIVEGYSSNWNVKIYHSPWDDRLRETIRTLMDWDVYPSFANLWDFVPYSFCVNWIADVGKTLADIDRAVYAQNLNVRSVSTSQLRGWSVKVDKNIAVLAGLPDLTSITMSTYQRLLGNSLYLPTPQLDWSSGWKSNIHTATALIVQRKMR